MNKTQWEEQLERLKRVREQITNPTQQEKQESRVEEATKVLDHHMRKRIPNILAQIRKNEEKILRLRQKIEHAQTILSEINQISHPHDWGYYQNELRVPISVSSFQVV